MNTEDKTNNLLLEDPASFKSVIKEPRVPIESWDYSRYDLSQKRELEKAWRKLTKEDQLKYGNEIANYLREYSFPIPTSEENNYRLIWQEAEKRLEPGSSPKIFTINDYDQNLAIGDLLELVENVDEIKNVYQIKKKMAAKNSMNTEEAKIVKSCLYQGRQLFESAKKSPMIAKPLIHFTS